VAAEGIALQRRVFAALFRRGGKGRGAFGLRALFLSWTLGLTTQEEIMARKRGTIGKLVVLAVLALAIVGSWTIWKAEATQNGYTTAKKTYNKAEKAAKAAHRAWQ